MVTVRKPLSLKIESHMVDRLKNEAKKNHWTIASIIRRLLQKWFDGKVKI